MAWRRDSEFLAHLGTGVFIRFTFAVAALAIGIYERQAMLLVPWVGVIVAIDLLNVGFDRAFPDLAERWRLFNMGVFLVTATVAVQVVGSAAIPLAFVPAVHTGWSLGRRGVVLVGWVPLVVAFAISELTRHRALHGTQVLAFVAALTVAALVASYWYRQPAGEAQIAAGEARNLLVRLNSLADSLDTGFDVPALGDSALEDIAQGVRLDRAALLLRTGEDAIPVGLFGQTRVPWPPPTSPGSVLAQSWQHGVPVRSVFGDDADRRYLLTAPVVGVDGAVIGMFVMDRERDPFSVTDQRQVESIASRVAPLIEVGVLFSRLRGRAALEERTRLARDMHDGVAQDLAALSFSIDILLQQTSPTDPVHRGLESLRQDMRASLNDIRHHISTLRMVERPDVSFGAILSAALQGFRTQTGLRTTLTLDESPFRLPAHIEIQIQRIVLDLLADARASGATFVDWDIYLAAPNARLVLMHDGATRLGSEAFRDNPLREHASIVVDSLIPAGLFLDITVGEDHRTHGRRTLSSPPARWGLGSGEADRGSGQGGGGVPGSDRAVLERTTQEQQIERS